MPADTTPRIAPPSTHNAMLAPSACGLTPPRAALARRMSKIDWVIKILQRSRGPTPAHSRSGVHFFLSLGPHPQAGLTILARGRGRSFGENALRHADVDTDVRQVDDLRDGDVAGDADQLIRRPRRQTLQVAE